MSTFEELRAKRPPRSGTCRAPGCDEGTAGRLQLIIQARKPAVSGSGSASYEYLDSTAGTFCEGHALEAYEAACQILNGHG